MTNKDALIATVGFEVPDNMALKALIDVGLAATQDYSATNRDAVDRCAIEVLLAMKTVNSISEGGYSVSFNHEEANKTITYLSSRLNSSTGSSGDAADAVNSVPKITSRPLW